MLASIISAVFYTFAGISVIGSALIIVCLGVSSHSHTPRKPEERGHWTKGISHPGTRSFRHPKGPKVRSKEAQGEALGGGGGGFQTHPALKGRSNITLKEK